MTQFHRT